MAFEQVLTVYQTRKLRLQTDTQMTQPILLRKQSIIITSNLNTNDYLPHIYSPAKLFFEAEYSKGSLPDLLLLARDIALRAVAADVSDRYQEALKLYKLLNERLDDAIFHLNIKERRFRASIMSSSTSHAKYQSALQDENSSAIAEIYKLRDNYKHRVTVILTSFPIESSPYYAKIKLRPRKRFKGPAVTSDVPFNEIFHTLLKINTPELYLWEELPLDRLEAKLEFLNRVSNSIITGDFCLEGLFVTPMVWSLSNSKLMGLETKNQALSDLIGALNRLKDHKMNLNDINMNQFERNITEFETTMELAKSLLFRKLRGLSEDESTDSLYGDSTNSNLKLMRGKMSVIIKGTFKSKSKPAEIDLMANYRSLLALFLSQSDHIFGTLLKSTRIQSRINMDIRSRLGRVLRFYQQVIYVMVVNDLTALLERFARKLKKELGLAM